MHTLLPQEVAAERFKQHTAQIALIIGIVVVAVSMFFYFTDTRKPLSAIAEEQSPVRILEAAVSGGVLDTYLLVTYEDQNGQRHTVEYPLHHDREKPLKNELWEVGEVSGEIVPTVRLRE